MKRSDVLYLLIGNNPMPNLISIAARINSIGQINCFYTKQTEKIFRQLRNVVEKKIKEANLIMEINGLEIDYINDISKVKKQLSDKITINETEMGTIELNFTGGNKVLSSAAFMVFKAKALNFPGTSILSYFDGENEEINSLILNKGPNNDKYETVKYSELDDILKITAKDIVEVHNVSGLIKLETPEIKFKNLSNRIYDEVMVSREHAVEFPNKIYEIFAYKKKKEIDENYNELISELLNYKQWRYFIKENDFHEGDKSYIDMSSKNKEAYLECLKGFWFEDYIAEILLELKDEGIIQEVFSSVKKKRDKQDDFEVDLMIYNNFSLKCISVTTLEKDESAKFKLYEVKTRAGQLSGDETRTAYINLCEDSEVLSNEYKKTWQQDLNDTLIISYNNLSKCKNLIKKWINKEEN